MIKPLGRNFVLMVFSCGCAVFQDNPNDQNSANGEKPLFKNVLLQVKQQVIYDENC
jgi:hypothetical protein